MSTTAQWFRQDCLWETALYKAASRGHTATVTELARLGADVNAMSEVCPEAAPRATGSRGAAACALDNPRSLQYRTALIIAAIMGFSATAVELVRLGANMDTKTAVR